MKKIVFTLVVLLIAMPASAAVVITCTEDSPDSNGWVTISYDSSGEANVPRGFALDISVDGGASIIDVNDNITEHFTIHPWNIQISPTGVLGDPGDAVAGAGEPGSCSGDSNCITIEMGSLYDNGGVAGVNAPPADGNLLKIQVDDNCTVSIVGNTLRGDIVLEDVSVADVDAPGCEVDDLGCYDDAGPVPGTYANWVTVGKPGSWCCAYQHLGDCNGDGYTNLQDLMMIFKPAYNSSFGGAGVYDADADCNRNLLVNLQDLMQCFKPNFNTNHGAPYDCVDDGHGVE